MFFIPLSTGHILFSSAQQFLQGDVNTEHFEVFFSLPECLCIQLPSDFSSCMNTRHKEMPGLQIFTQSICDPMLSKSSKQSINYNSGMVPSAYISQFILSPQPWKSKNVLLGFIDKEIEAYRIYFLPQLQGAFHKADMQIRKLLYDNTSNRIWAVGLQNLHREPFY